MNSDDVDFHQSRQQKSPLQWRRKRTRKRFGVKTTRQHLYNVHVLFPSNINTYIRRGLVELFFLRPEITVVRDLKVVTGIGRYLEKYFILFGYLNSHLFILSRIN